MTFKNAIKRAKTRRDIKIIGEFMRNDEFIVFEPAGNYLSAEKFWNQHMKVQSLKVGEIKVMGYFLHYKQGVVHMGLDHLTDEEKSSYWDWKY
jgi:hypothetical protein